MSKLEVTIKFPKLVYRRSSHWMADYDVFLNGRMIGQVTNHDLLGWYYRGGPGYHKRRRDAGRALLLATMRKAA